MAGLIEAAGAILKSSSARLEVGSQNIANATTTGYKRRLRNSSDPNGFSAAARQVRQDLSSGKLQQTDSSLDVAIAGEGWFQLREGDDMLYSRQGSFRLMPDGTVAGAGGGIVQQAGGGDLVLETERVRVAPDGTVFDAEAAVGRIGVFTAPAASFEAVDGTSFRLVGNDVAAVDDPQIRQGMLEASNVAVADEMIGIMAALRQAEAGSRLVQTWDELMGRANSTFGQSAAR